MTEPQGPGISVVLTAELGEIWGTREDLSGLTDAEIVELIHEDVLALFDGRCKWTVVRHA